MPQLFEIELSDGRIVEVESGEEPTQEQLMSALGSWEEPQSAPVPLQLEPPSFLDVPQSSEELGARNFQGAQEIARTFPGYTATGLESPPISEEITKALSVSPQTVQNAGEVWRAAGIARNLQGMGIPVNVDQVMANVAGGREVAPSRNAQIVAGVQNVGAGLAGSFADPMNAAAMGASMVFPPIAPLVSGAFGLNMASHIGEQARAAGEASVSGTPYEKTVAYGNLATTAAFVPGLGAHAVSPITSRLTAAKPATKVTDTQLQPGVSREGISAEVAKPVQSASEVGGFVNKFKSGEKVTTEESVAAGMKAKTIADLDALAKSRLEITEGREAFKEALSKETDPAKKMEMMNRNMAMNPQFPREAIESATNTGSHVEGEGMIPTKYGERPLDWRNNPEVAEWLKANAEKLKIPLPEELKTKAAEAAKPTERVSLDDLEVAINLNGEPITGGGSHMEIGLKGGDMDMIEAASKPENQGFKYKGKFISREKAAELIGEKLPLTSERLTELRELRQKSSATELTSASAQPSEPVAGETLAPAPSPESKVVDWASATEESPQVAESATVSAGAVPEPQIVEMGAGIPIPKFADRKMSPLDRVTTSHSGKLQKSFSEARLAQKEIKQAVPSDRRQGALSIYREAGGDMAVLKDWEARAKQKWMRDAARDAQSLTSKESGLLPKIDSTYFSMETRGNNFDVLGSHRDNYVTHMWDVKRPGTGFGGGRLKDRFRFAKARTFNTFFEGDQAGFKPKTLAIGKLLPAYIHEMNRVITDRQAVRDLAKGTMPDGSPMVTPRGNAKVVDGAGGKAVLVSPKTMREADTSDYRVMADQPALSNWTWEGKDTDGNPVFVKADLAVHPDVYRRLNAMMGQSELRKWASDPVTGTAQIPRAVVRGLDTAQSAMKREMFGLLAPFHQVQEGTHAVGHLVNPFFGLEKVDLVNNPNMADAANHGLMMLPDRASAQVYMEGVGTRSSLLSQGLRKIPILKEQIPFVKKSISDVIDGYQDYLFHQYIPALKYKTYEAMVGRNTKLYAKELASGEMTPADVKLTSAEQANAAYGHLNYALLDRNPTIQHFIQLAALAPDFLEARVRFAGQGVKGLRSKVGHEQLKAIAILAAAQAGTAFMLSQLLGVPYDEEHPFEVVYGGRRYAMRSVPEDIFGLIKDTRQFVYSRVNPLTVKGTVQLATGLNYRGEKVSATETMAELLAGYIPITARAIPAVRSLTETGRHTPVTPLQQLAGSLGLRISRYSPVSETYRLAGEWMEKQKLPKDRGSYPVSKYQQLRYALEDGDLERAKAEYETLKKDTPARKVRDGFKQSLNHPFTGSQADDKKFVKTLTGYDKELYDEAVRTRKNILKAFYSL